YALFKDVVRAMTRNGTSIMFLMNQYVLPLADAARIYLISCQGRLAKTLRQDDFTLRQMNDFLTRKSEGGSSERSCVSPGAVLLRAEQLSTDGNEPISFTLRHGEVLGFYGHDKDWIENLIYALSGLHPYAGQLYLDEKPIVLKNAGDAFGQGIGLLPSDPEQLFFPDLTVEGNIQIPFGKRLSNRLGILRGGSVRALMQDVEKTIHMLEDSFPYSGYRDCIFPVLTRFLLYPYRVIVLLHPGMHNDAIKMEMLQTLAKSAAQCGCGMIVASTRLSELRAICSNIHFLE
ncbi:MAG: hypothetical protein RSD95_15430, partial [Clostridia bacterium]